MREAAPPPAGTGTLTHAPPRTRTQAFPATPDQARQARRFLASILDGSPLTSDALVCLSELVTNSIRHSHPARPSTTITIRITLDSARLRAEVEDAGGPWAPGQATNGQEAGRGLLIVAALATTWGTSGGGTGPRTVWFEMDPYDPPRTAHR